MAAYLSQSGEPKPVATPPPSANCPDLIFVNPRFDVYRAMSLQIREDVDGVDRHVVVPEHLHVVSQDVQRHFGADVLQGPYLRGEAAACPLSVCPAFLRDRLVYLASHP
jgi:hypothetical protein